MYLFSNKYKITLFLFVMNRKGYKQKSSTLQQYKIFLNFNNEILMIKQINFNTHNINYKPIVCFFFHGVLEHPCLWSKMV